MIENISEGEKAKIKEKAEGNVADLLKNVLKSLGLSRKTFSDLIWCSRIHMREWEEQPE